MASATQPPISGSPAEIEATCGQRDTAPVRVQVVHGKGECCREDGGLEQWEASSRQRAGTCMVVGCDGKPEIGARVERIGDPGRVYLVPLCKACAARQADVLTIVRGVRLVPAEVRDTRGSRPVFAVRLADLGSTRYEGCSCGSWLEHWETFSSQRAGYCLVDGCHGMPEIGAAVQRPGEPGNVYIVPMCKACADKRDETLELANGAHLVPADVRDTCAVADEAEEIHWTTNVA